MLLLLLQALVLGLVQGLTEFLPVSSSGHLQGVPYLLGWDAGGNVAFDATVHAGTLGAVVWYFRKDLWELTAGALGIGDVAPQERRQAWLMIGLLAVGTVPAAAAGLLFADVFEAAFASPRIVVAFLYLTAIVLWAAERLHRRRQHAAATDDARRATGSDGGIVTVDQIGRDTGSLSVRDAVAIGLAQALSIFPGVSRSGATIAAAMSLGLSRAAAARFSFLLSIPIIAGAILVTIPDLGETQPGTLPFGPVEVAVGVIAAGVSGYWAIRYLLALLQRTDLLGFARYVTVFATILLIGTFVRG